MDDLIEALRKLDTRVSDSIFKNPSREEIVGLYCLAIQEVMGKAITQIRYEEARGTLKSNPKYNVFETYGFNIDRDSYKSLGDLRFYRYCQRLHSLLGLQPMNPSTILSPVSADIKKFGKAFLSFLKFRDGILSMLDLNMEKLIQLVDSKYSIEAQIEESTKQFDGFTHSNEKDLNSIYNMKQQKMSLEAKLSMINEEYNIFKRRYEATEDRINELNDSIQQLHLQISVAEQSKLELQEQVVKDPELYKKELSRYINQIEAGNNEIKALEKAEGKLKAKCTNLQIALSRLESTTNCIISHLNTVINPYSDLLSSIHSSTNESKELDNKLEAINEEIKENNQKLLACKNEQDATLKQISSLNDIVEDNNKKIKDMENMAGEKIEAVYKIVNERESSIMELEKEIKKLEIIKVNQDSNFNSCIQEILSMMHPYERLRLN